MKLNSSHIANTATGYGRMSHHVHTALERLGVEMHMPPHPDHPERRPMHKDNLWLGLPAHVKGWYEGQRNHVLTMWEASVLPEGFRAELAEFDTVIVPSEQNRELFSHFHPNVRKIPLGVDPTLWHYRKRPAVDQEFRFLVSGRGSRKGVDVAVRAFETVFGNWTPTADHPVPMLTIKSTSPQNVMHGPQVREIAVSLSDQEEVDLYADVHCFLGLSRGEGWGLMPFQAMAQGCPTILTDAHGHAEYSHLTPESLRIACTMAQSDPFVFGDAGEWWEPDFDAVCAAMWDVYCNYEDYLAPAAASAEVIAEEYRWDGTAASLIMAIGGPDALEEPDITAFQWHSLNSAVFHIVTNCDRTYEVNGVQYQFVKGVDYWEYADLKRIMFEHGVLDPVCLDPIGSGLLPGQISAIDRYKAQHGICHACGQRLNMDPSIGLDFDDADAMGLAP